MNTRSAARVVVLTFGVIGAGCTAWQPMPPMPDINAKFASADSQRATLRGIEYDSTGVQDPTVRKIPRRVYPPAADNAGKQGWVLFQFVIGTDGRIEPGSDLVLEASDPVFVRNARDVIRGMIYTPAKRNGLPLRVVGRQAIVFERP
jgi:outer membrane biosynthesis protein TonB